MLIFGASGFAKQLLPSLQNLGLLEKCVFYDNVTNDNSSYIARNFKIIRSDSDLHHYFLKHSKQFTIGIGGPKNRQLFSEKLTLMGGTFTSILDPSSRISNFDVSLGDGVCILQDVIIEPSVQIGKGVLVNVRVLVTHDCSIGDFTEISPSAILLGGAQIGKACFIGAGAVILPRVQIGDNCIIGAGAIVNKSIGSGQKVAGVPARPI
jgi:sugar O-acyltransferase (sialic acid O-acetyltransferase NeuD family)